MKTQIVLQDFEGPLDLLLALIEEQKIDILDIPIAQITEQYNEIIYSWSEYDLEEVSEYLLMATRLIRIKSQMLLPRPNRRQEYSDPRQELANQLLEYKALKDVAAFLKDLSDQQSFSYSKDPEYFGEKLIQAIPNFSMIDLERAFRRIIERIEPEDSVAEIKREEYSVERQIALILKRLDSRESFEFGNLFMGHVVSEEVVVTFLAVLELYKMGEIDFSQEDGFYIYRNSKLS